jgi:DNA-binding winged helix-turn-helix (wHTH) protein
LQAKPVFDTSQLTAKENLLLEYLLDRVGQVCEKDDLVRAVWPEDVIYEQGIRDESLAQLMRRLRVKIEPDAANPTYIHTVPGRGYLFRAK